MFFRHGLKKESSGRLQQSGGNGGGGSGPPIHDDTSAQSHHRQLSEARSALRDAESKILSLERSRDVDTSRLWEMQERLSRVEAERDKQASLLRADVRRLEAERDIEKERTLKLEREWRDESKMGEYASLVDEVLPSDRPNGGGGGGGSPRGDWEQRNGVHPDSPDSGKSQRAIAKLKHHLARALRRMEVISNQSASVQTSCDSLLKRMRDDYARDLDQKCQDQVKIMNELAVRQLEKEDLEVQWKEEREMNERAVRDLESRLEESEGKLRELEEAVASSGGCDGVESSAWSLPGYLEPPQSEPAVAPRENGAERDGDIERQLQELICSKDKMEADFRKKASDRDRMIAWLEEENYVKDRLIKKLQRGEGDSTDGASSTRGRDRNGSMSHSLSTTGEGSVGGGGGGGGPSGSANDDKELSPGDLHLSSSSLSQQHHASVSTGMSHKSTPAAEWMNPLDASLMGMSFSVLPTALKASDATVETQKSTSEDRTDDEELK